MSRPNPGKIGRDALNACRIIVTCWDRSKTHADLAEQIGAHVEDMRDIVRQADLKLVACTASPTSAIQDGPKL